MHLNVHLVGIIWFSVNVLFVCFWTINHLAYGTQFNEFVTFPNLVVIDGIILLFCEVIFLKYFHTKGYKIAFILSLVSAITFLVLYTAVYSFFARGIGSGGLINIVASLHLIAVTMFSLGLVFSKASEQPLLKKAGYVGAVVGLIILFTHVAVLNMPEGDMQNGLININTWFGRLGGLIAIFYILNFYQEFKGEIGAAT
jgi:hypothetical protein